MHPLEALPRVECARELLRHCAPGSGMNVRFFFFLGIFAFADFATRLGRILAVQNQINPFYYLSTAVTPYTAVFHITVHHGK